MLYILRTALTVGKNKGFKRENPSKQEQIYCYMHFQFNISGVEKLVDLGAGQSGLVKYCGEI